MFNPMKEKDKDGAPIKYEIYLTFKSYANKYCPDCLRCVENCPTQAIKITF
jgi:ferredoxin